MAGKGRQEFIVFEHEEEYMSGKWKRTYHRWGSIDGFHTDEEGVIDILMFSGFHIEYAGQGVTFSSLGAKTLPELKLKLEAIGVIEEMEIG